MERSRSGRRWHRGAVAAITLALLATLGGYGRPSITSAATSPFTDIAGTTFEADVDWLWAEGITKGCSPTLYCPDHIVTRAEMASFLARMFALPATVTDYYTDDQGTTHEREINKLAASGITTGCTATTFCPNDPVSRGQMASFLTRAVPLSDGAGNDYFRDDDATTHEGDIDRAAAAGISTGCWTWLYCPSATVTRGQMAGFLHRVETPVTPPPHPAPSGSQTLFVGVDGDDKANACLVEADPCRTIGHAIDVAVGGDAIDVGPGTFHEYGLAAHMDLTITGMPGATTIDAGRRNGVRVVSVGRHVTVTLAHLTLTGGGGAVPGYVNGRVVWAPGTAMIAGGAIWNGGTLQLVDVTARSNVAMRGGGIFNDQGATLGMTDSSVRDNIAEWGGGIFNFGTLSITGSSVDGNKANGAGGIHTTEDMTVQGSNVIGNVAGLGGAGGMSTGTSKVAIVDTTIADNVASGVGGGIAGQDVSISTSTISGNRASFGGGVRSGILKIDRSTVTANVATSSGGGICAHVVEITNTTITANRADVSGGGVSAICGSEGADAVVFENSTITGNRAGTSAGVEGGVGPMELRNTLVMANVTTHGSELVSPDGWIENTASIIGIPPGLTLADVLDPAGLKDNGGPTETIGLTDSVTNPARHKGDAATCAADPVSGLDQRGLPRTAPCDIGAYELQP